MPTYEYECEKCSLIFEEFQSISADPLTQCPNPECKGKVKRLFSGGAGFLFKGSGFYITDYRSESYKKAEKSDTSPPSTSTDSKKDKPASKSEGTSKSKGSSKNNSKSSS